ncbi:kelch-like protein 2 isoform X5 [Pipistrellus kuhlii]|uniref:kelch-like protein 2 isoform X5 n=1 Tax=Pipistrellus kuhlii TaxID=59472 RepID=UPI001E2712CF|nr:kelch-like protein 2 isoform X5 [Pipistrellus kuhlii]
MKGISLRVRHASYLALSFTKLSNRGDNFFAFYLEGSAEPCLQNFWCSSLTGRCTKQGHQKPVDSKDDSTEKHCPVTVNPWHVKKAFKVMNELRSQNLLCDVTIVAEDMEISAHRVVLAACSPYFHAMFTEQHFADVVLSEEFLNLGIEQVCSLISSDKLTISSEEKVFEAVIAWVNHDKDVRQEFMARLMEHVRLPLLPREYLVQRVEEEALVKNSSACKDYLIEAMKYHLLPTEQRILMKSVRTRLRTPMNLPKLMVVVGGQAPKAIRSVECYDFKEERWHQVAELPSRRCRAGMVYMAGLVFAVGGFNGSLRVRTVDSYDPVKDQWTSVANMRDRRSTLGAAVLNGLLYAVGGFDGSTGLASVEAYNIKSNEWFHVAPMNTRRSSVGVGVVGGLLYAVGGYDGASRQCLSTVECYNATTNEWAYIAEMSTRRSGAGVGVLNNLLYAVGGHDGPLVRKSVEVYDPTTNTWRQVADMNMCRRNAGVCAVNGLLYVVGGDDGSCNLASVEYYNPTTDKWTVVSSCMSTGRSYAGVTVIDKPL